MLANAGESRVGFGVGPIEFGVQDRIEGSMSEPDDTVRHSTLHEVIESALAGGGSPSAKSLIGACEAAGIDRERAKRGVAELIARDAVAAAWADWTSVTDRDEIRLRLEVIARAGVWSEQLASFVTFFFRASVADLYQPAAVAMGRHLHRSDRLRSYIQRYSKDRGVALNKPLGLGGGRTQRRVLILLCAARGMPDAGIGPAPMPLATEAGGRRAALPESAADLAVTLQAIALLVDGSPEDEAVRAIAEDALDRTPASSPGQAGRTVLQRYGALLAKCAGPSTPGRWRRMFLAQLENLRALPTEAYAERVAGLIRVDEMLRTGALLGEADGSAALGVVAETCQPLESAFFSARMLLWHRRERSADPSWMSAAAEASAGPAKATEAEGVTIAGVIGWVCRRVVVSDAGGSMFAGADAEPAELVLLDRLLSCIESRERWSAFDDPTRALLTALLLDAARHLNAGRGAASVLRRRGLPPPESEGVSVGDALLSNVLLRVLSWGGPGASSFVDVRTIHRIDDTRVLLALLPSDERSPVLSVLADAMEHQLRWRLRREASFAPDALLRMALVRRPHASFFESLWNVCTGRNYKDSVGVEVDVPQLVANAAADARWRVGEPCPAPVFGDAVGKADGARLREELAALSADAPDLRERVVRLTNLIGDPSGERAAARGTLIGLLEQTGAQHQPFVLRGYPAWSTGTLAELEGELAKQLARARVLVSRALPETWSGLDGSREALLSLRATLDQAAGRLADALPRVEAELLGTAVESMHRDLSHWAELLGEIAEAWPDAAARRAEPEELATAMARVASIDADVVRRHLLGVLWRSSLDSASAVETAAEAFGIRCSLLDGLLGHGVYRSASEDRGLLVELATETWVWLVKDASGRNEEARVVALVEDARYEELRRRPGAADAMRDALKWCLDRYLTAPASSIARDLERRAHRRGALGRLAVHYSTVWVSLLIGAIFMLDFGDAWTEMAENGDVIGIGITFAVGIAGAFGYIYWNLRRKSSLSPGQSVAELRLSHRRRAVAFAGVCLLYSLAATGGLWLLLSGTDAVVTGAGAIGHIIVWSGFAMFVGVFFGLIAGDA